LFHDSVAVGRTVGGTKFTQELLSRVSGPGFQIARFSVEAVKSFRHAVDERELRKRQTCPKES
jgi:hypothetical protein